jgi:hypothetical protein
MREGRHLLCRVHPLAWRPKCVFLCKIWGFHGADYEKCRVLGHKKPFHTSQEMYYVSVKDPGRLMLCKIWGFHGRDYEECRILGYKHPVRTLQEKHYVSATEPSQLMLCYDIRYSRRWLWRMLSSGMLGRVALVRTDVSKETSFNRVTRFGGLGTTLAVTSNWSTLLRYINYS